MNTAAVPVQDYRVFTTSGRMFIWAAMDAQDLINQVYAKGHVIQYAVLNSKYEAEQAALKEVA